MLHSVKKEKDDNMNKQVEFEVNSPRERYFSTTCSRRTARLYWSTSWSSIDIIQSCKGQNKEAN